MKRFLLFAGASYYAEGGMSDYIASFDTEGAARASAEKGEDWLNNGNFWPYDWWHVLDTETGRCVASNGHESTVEL